VNLEHFLDLFFRSNVLIIEVLFGTVLAGIIFLTVRSFTRPEEIGDSSSLKGLEEGLKKILDNYSPGTKLNSDHSMAGGEADASGGLVEEMSTQIERLKIQLMQKSEEVEQLKANGAVLPSDGSVAAPASSPSSASAPASGDGGNTAGLEEKIKDLEARLSEYSIIEDDIADLSFYKEETVRLQGEVDKLKEKLAEYDAGGAVAAAATPAAVAAPALAPTPEFKPAPVAVAPVESIPSPIEAAPSDLPSVGVDDDIMAEFERAVAEQKALSSPQTAVRAVPPVSEEVVPEPASESNQAPSEESPEESVGGINLDKMLNEVGALPEADAAEMTNALEQALDTEKLLQEATGMDKIDTEAMNEFDNFLKKEGA
jgi:hypothetical protein